MPIVFPTAKSTDCPLVVLAGLSAGLPPEYDGSHLVLGFLEPGAAGHKPLSSLVTACEDGSNLAPTLTSPAQQLKAVAMALPKALGI